MTFYVTFGQAHPLRDGWVEIEAETYPIARAQAFETFGQKFAFIRETNDQSSMASYFPDGKYGRTLVADPHLVNKPQE